MAMLGGKCRLRFRHRPGLQVTVNSLQSTNRHPQILACFEHIDTDRHHPTRRRMTKRVDHDGIIQSGGTSDFPEMIETLYRSATPLHDIVLTVAMPDTEMSQ